MKKYLTRALAAVLGVALALLPAALSGGQGERSPAPEAPDFTYEIRWRRAGSHGGDDYELCFFSADGEICRLPKNQYTHIPQHDFSMGRGFAAAFSQWSSDGGGDLYRVSAAGCDFIADGVFYGLISDDGDRLAYIQYDDDGSGSLYLYEHGSGETRLLDSSVTTEHETARFAISPDGGTVLYCRAEDGYFTGMVWHEGRYRELGRNVFPVAAANDMAHLYYAAPENADDPLNSDYTLYVKSGLRKTALLSCNASPAICFNRDLSEIFACTFERFERVGQVFANGAGRVIKLDYSMNELVEPYVNFYYDDHANPYRFFAETNIRMNIDTFAGQRVVTDYGGERVLGVINSDFSLTPITPVHFSDDDCQFSQEDNSLLLMRDSSLYFIDGVSGERVIRENVKRFVASPELSEIYYQTTDGELYYLDLASGGESRLIAENAELSRLTMYGSEINAESWRALDAIGGILMDGECYFTDAERQTLYASRHGGAPREVYSTAEGGIRFCLLGERLLINRYHFSGDYPAMDYYLIEDGSPALLASDIGYK